MADDGGSASGVSARHDTISVDNIKTHPTVTALSNAIAGAACTLITQPIAALRTRLQSLNIYNHGIPNDNKNKIKSILNISMKDGIFTLYRGGGCSMVISAVGWFLFRFTFDAISQSKIVELESNTATKLANGSLSSLITTAVLHPAWNAKLNLELQTGRTKMDGWPQYRGATHYLLSTFRKEGIAALYKGWEANLVGVFYYGFVICLYESLSEFDWQRYKALQNAQNFKPVVNGMIARIIPTALCYPVYVSRTMQICFATELTHRKLHEVFFWTLKNKKLKGLYAGFQMQLVKSIISGGITFGFYEAILAAIVRGYNFVHD
ncbi:Mitochondrial nicotinamide adenine dinucleotide transporter 2 [Babesia sp. Xinjiang]|uniref:Mitochondrial nicotinamide adenine dinucleotide transporter 2 n=1 Tax=Babesia sp. Xinjiang TaxID=462227 RepID=UPI000A21D918|nr:Mitochondrial nicotinamide adenine dinucleotide transporter 2 [Babesia sp. Xinjiang]ORM40005.1 Mitochondrial nicotinamide adenine dinucleotide transporter 2 [Babesia sp. Xinjiang]